MKTLGKIKLNQLSKDELDQRALNTLKGGCACGSIHICNCTEACRYNEFAAIYTHARSVEGVIPGYQY